MSAGETGGRENAYHEIEQLLITSSTEDLENELVPQLEAITDLCEDTSSYEDNRGDKIEDEDVYQYIDSPDEESELELGEGIVDGFDSDIDILPVANQDADPELRADIIFYKADSEITYEVHIGKLEYFLSLVPTRVNAQDIMLTVGGTEISYDSLCEAIRKKKYRLTLLAEFLAKAQKRFLLAPSMETALSQCRSYDQNDFTRFVHNTEKSSDDIAKFIKKNKPWVSRIVRKKAKVPFSGELLTLDFFFDTYIERINILRKAFEINLQIESHAPLNATDQKNIINAILPLNEYSKFSKTKPNETELIQTKQNTVKDQLWPTLRELYSKDQRPALRLDNQSGSETKTTKQVKEITIPAIINLIKADYP